MGTAMTKGRKANIWIRQLTPSEQNCLRGSSVLDFLQGNTLRIKKVITRRQ